jgi:hypothetical protein
MTPPGLPESKVINLEAMVPPLMSWRCYGGIRGTHAPTHDGEAPIIRQIVPVCAVSATSR